MCMCRVVLCTDEHQVLGRCALAFNVIDPTCDTAAAATTIAVTAVVAATVTEQPQGSHKGFKVCAAIYVYYTFNTQYLSVIRATC